MIITFASSKGGVGKSTACAAVGSRLAQRGEQVVIFDLDQNRTLERWGRKATVPGLKIVAVERDQFTTSFREAVSSGDVDHVLIDLAGAREATNLKAMARSDLVVIPAQASEPDLREAWVVSRDVADVAEERKAVLPYRVLLTKMPSLRTRVSDHSVQQLSAKGLPFFRTWMVERVAYKEMFFTGFPPSATETTGASAEISNLIAEIEELVGAGQGAAAGAHELLQQAG